MLSCHWFHINANVLMWLPVTIWFKILEPHCQKSFYCCARSLLSCLLLLLLGKSWNSESVTASVPATILIRMFFLFSGSASALFGQLCHLQAHTLLRSTPQKGAGGVNGQQWTGRQSSTGTRLRHPGCGGWWGGWWSEKTATTQWKTCIYLSNFL